MDKLKKPFVVRATGIETTDRAEAERLVRGAIERQCVNDEEQTPSFKAVAVPSCDSPTSCDVLLDFEKDQPFPSFLSRLRSHPSDYVTISSNEEDITFDSHYYGFTQLYPTEPGYPITADIIAITGLDGHAYGSWTAKNPPYRMWLRNFLSKDLPTCRTMIYGYNSKLSEYGIDKLLDYGRDFLEEIKRSRGTKELRERPLIFIAHSYGGLVLMQSLIRAKLADSRADPDIVSVNKATFGILFFGTPFRGLPTANMLSMLEEGHPRRELVNQLQPDSDLLVQLLTDFKNLCEDFRIVSIYETKQTQQLKPDCSSTGWGRTGAFATAVDSGSALLELPDTMEMKIRVAEDHTRMVKFDNRNEGTYKKVMPHLKKWQREACDIVANRFSPVNEQAASKVNWHVPFPKNHQFVGRQEELETLVCRLYTTSRFSRFAITGLGGIGKTQIALELAHRIRYQHPHCSVHWIPSNSIEMFEKACRDIGHQLGISGVEKGADVKALVRDHFNLESSGQWLWIIDNADDLDMWYGKPRLKECIPQSSRGCVIFTTRNRQMAVKVTRNVIEVPDVNKETAFQIFREALINQDIQWDETTEQLLEQLAFLPLAIVQAAAYINTMQITTSKYLDLLHGAMDAKINPILSTDFEDEGRYLEQKNAVTTTWLVSFHHIKKYNLLAAHYLSFMSCMSPKNIPISILPPLFLWETLLQRKRVARRSIKRKLKALTSRTLPQERTSIDIENRLDQEAAIALLKSFSFISEREGGQTFDMHRLVHLATRNWTQKLGILDRYVRRAVLHLAYLMSFGYQGTMAMWRTFLPHAQHVLQLTPAHDRNRHLLLEAYGLCLHADGRLHEAEQVLVEVLESRKKIQGSAHVATLDIMSSLILVYINQGHYDKAMQLAVEALKKSAEALGDDNRYTLLNRSYLAIIYLEKGHYDKAEQLEIEVMKQRVRLLGEDHPDMLISMSNLATIYFEKYKFNKAEQLRAKVVETRKRMLGNEHPQTLRDMSHLALIYTGQGHHEKAEQLQMEVFKSSKKLLGDDHPTTLISMSYLAKNYAAQGLYDKAEQLEAQAMKQLARMRGEKHPRTLLSMSDIASLLNHQGRKDEALELMRQSAEMSAVSLGERHPDTEYRWKCAERWHRRLVDNDDYLDAIALIL